MLQTAAEPDREAAGQHRRRAAAARLRVHPLVPGMCECSFGLHARLRARCQGLRVSERCLPLPLYVSFLSVQLWPFFALTAFRRSDRREQEGASRPHAWYVIAASCFRAVVSTSLFVP